MINWSLSPRWDKRLVGLGQDSPTSEVNLVFLHTVLSVACWLLNFFFFSFPFSFPFPFPVSVFRFFSFFLLAYFPCRQGCKTRRMSGSVELIESTINITNLAKTPGSCWSWKEAPNRRYCFLVLKRKSHITIWDVAIKITASKATNKTAFLRYHHLENYIRAWKSSNYELGWNTVYCAIH